MLSATSSDAARTLAWLCDSAGESSDRPRAAVVVAHPDDEVIGAGGRLRMIAPVLLAHVTDGAPRDLTDARRAGCASRLAYARLRRAERNRAAALAGIAGEHCRDFDVADQDAALVLAPIAVRTAHLLLDHDIDVVLTHAYEGGHPDHDATAFAVHAGCALLRRDGYDVPAIVELTSYHAGARGELEVGCFLAASAGIAREVVLSADSCLLKRRLFECYASQRAVLAQFPIAVERFRIAPSYDFAAPPHAGALHYEHYDWGLNGAQWRERARDVLEALRLGPAI